MIEVCHELSYFNFWIHNAKKYEIVTNQHNFSFLFQVEFFRELNDHQHKQSKKMIIYPQNNELLGDNMVTMIDVQFNCLNNTTKVLRKHEFNMISICCAVHP